MNSAETLAPLITRNLPPIFSTAGQSLAQRLIDCAHAVPDGSILILGGSLARGEPIIDLAGSAVTLVSDIDFALVHASLLPPVTSADFEARYRSALPTVTLLTVRRDEYDQLQTGIGYDFKDEGILIGPGRLPPFEPVRLTSRDAVEVFIFAIFLYLFDDLAARAAAGDDGRSFHYAHARIAAKIIRSVGLARGLYSLHECVSLPPPFGDYAAQEIGWLHQPSKDSFLPPDRIWDLFQAALALHDAKHSGEIADAVTGTEYQERPGAAFVAEHQRRAVCLLREVLGRRVDGSGRAGAYAAFQAAEMRLIERGMCRQEPLSRLVSARADVIRQSLLEMKVSVAQTPTGSGGRTEETAIK